MTAPAPTANPRLDQAEAVLAQAEQQPASAIDLPKKRDEIKAALVKDIHGEILPLLQTLGDPALQEKALQDFAQVLGAPDGQISESTVSDFVEKQLPQAKGLKVTSQLRLALADLQTQMTPAILAAKQNENAEKGLTDRITDFAKDALEKFKIPGVSKSALAGFIFKFLSELNKMFAGAFDGELQEFWLKSEREQINKFFASRKFAGGKPMLFAFQDADLLALKGEKDTWQKGQKSPFTFQDFLGKQMAKPGFKKFQAAIAQAGQEDSAFLGFVFSAQDLRNDAIDTLEQQLKDFDSKDRNTNPLFNENGQLASTPESARALIEAGRQTAKKANEHNAASFASEIETASWSVQDALANALKAKALATKASTTFPHDLDGINLQNSTDLKNFQTGARTFVAKQIGAVSTFEFAENGGALEISKITPLGQTSSLTCVNKVIVQDGGKFELETNFASPAVKAQISSVENLALFFKMIGEIESGAIANFSNINTSGKTPEFASFFTQANFDEIVKKKKGAAAILSKAAAMIPGP